MIIRSLNLCNFGVYKGKQSLKLATSIEANLKPLTIVGGMNGTGKTSLLDAILLVLYGKRSPLFQDHEIKYPEYLKSLVNKDVALEEGGWAELDIEVPADTHLIKLRIRRSWKKAKVNMAERLEVWRDEEPDLFLAKNWDFYVEELLPQGLASLFCFDGERIAEIAESETTPQTVQRAIRTILGLDLVDQLIADLGTVIRRNQGKMKGSTLKKQLTIAEEESGIIVSKLDKARQELAKINTDIARSDEQLRQSHERYLQQGGLLMENRKAIIEKTEQLQQDWAEKKAELVMLAGGPSPLLLVQPLLERIAERKRDEEKSREAEYALPIVEKYNKKMIDFLRSRMDNDELLIQLGQEAATHECELRSLAEGKRVYALTGSGMSQISYLLEELSEGYEDRVGSALEDYQTISVELERAERHLSVDYDAEKLSDEIAHIIDLTKKSEDLKHKHAELELKIESMESEQEMLERKITKLAQELVGNEEAKRIIKYAARSQETMRAFRECVTNKKVSDLTIKIQDAFSYLTHKANLVNCIQIDANSLQIRLLDSKGHEIVKSRLSSGERQMLAISILWGLGQSSRYRIPVIIDTPMGRLDSSHRMNFVSKYLPNASHQVVVLSTDTEITGSYFECLKDYVGKQYLLSFDNNSKSTVIKSGYFESVGGDS
jgi:DNA sulfur modification protein DndD